MGDPRCGGLVVDVYPPLTHVYPSSCLSAHTLTHTLIHLHTCIHATHTHTHKTPTYSPPLKPEPCWVKAPVPVGSIHMIWYQLRSQPLLMWLNQIPSQFPSQHGWLNTNLQSVHPHILHVDWNVWRSSLQTQHSFIQDSTLLPSIPVPTQLWQWTVSS